jgi:hypothetical protein
VARRRLNAGGLAGVAAGVGSALALSPDGSFRELDLSDPAAPRVIAHYKRAAGISRFSGISRVGNRVVLFGEDGLEVVAREGAAYRRLSALDRGSAGAVIGVEVIDGQLLAAGTRGLIRTPLDGGPVERLFDRPLRGMARSGDTLLVLDDQWLYRTAAPGRLAGFAKAAELSWLAARGARWRRRRGFGAAASRVSTFRRRARVRSARRRPLGSVTDVAVVGGSVFRSANAGSRWDPSAGASSMRST